VRRSSEHAVGPSKQSKKGFVVCANRTAVLQVRTARESTRKGCILSL
jgi:hypothetical protein